ncbi:zinc metalloprotease [Sphaerisporangium viridialbum]|uniref:zinc metalloprotease n=1 Tax=Sphaerisporangium viridialbum TaxID=46189 RepID=UPI003C783643
MVRRTVAVSLVCLFTLAGVPGPARAAATRSCGHARPPRADTREAGRHAPGARVAKPDMRGAEPYTLGPREAARMLSGMRRRLRASQAAEPRAVTVTVPLWIHVITDGRMGATDASLGPQVDTLNAAYGGRLGGVDTGIRFVLRGVTHTDNPTWFREPLGNEAAMKQRLRKGGPETLNLYVAQLGELVLGYATYPHWYQSRPSLDGVVIDWRSLPGGALRDFSKGYTAVHEIGHWLGLLHTFENGCAQPGDSVDDTPPEAVPTQGCPARKDTCPDTGEDPIHNFMDYAHDRCMSEFTAGQAARMHDMWTAYRAPAV